VTVAVSWVLTAALLVWTFFVMLAQTTTQGYAPPASAYLTVLVPALVVSIFAAFVLFGAHRQQGTGSRFWLALPPALVAAGIVLVMGVEAARALVRQRTVATAPPGDVAPAGDRRLVRRKRGDPVASLEFRLEAPSPSPPESLLVKGPQGEDLALLREPVIRNADVSSVEVEEAGILFRVVLHLTPEAGVRMGAATRPFPGRRMAVFLDGRVVAAPVIRFAVGETAVIDAGFSREEAYRVARAIAP
jgi:hypothetical protein